MKNSITKNVIKKNDYNHPVQSAVSSVKKIVMKSKLIKSGHMMLRQLNLNS